MSLFLKEKSRIKFAILLSCLLYVWDLGWAGDHGERAISIAELRAHVEFLTSQELLGRDAPGAGADLAARYIATRFGEYSLNKLPDAPNYYQEIPLTIAQIDLQTSGLSITRNGQTVNFNPNQDVFFFPKKATDVKLEVPVLLCGYGIRAPEYHYDDFATLDPKDKLLLIFDREPQENDTASVFNGNKPTRYSSVFTKIKAAKELGAVGLMIVQPPNNHLPPIGETLPRQQKSMTEPIVQLADSLTLAHPEPDFPVFYLSDAAARGLLGESFDLAAYQAEIDRELRSAAILLEDVQVVISVAFKDRINTTTQNVVGIYPGKTDEWVLLMAHYDHLGVKNGALYAGADDNASGVAGVLAIAKAFSTQRDKLRRGVIFLATGAEEDGTLGALYFSRQLGSFSEKIVAAINLDEIGRDGSSQFRAMRDPHASGEKDLLMIFYSGQTPSLADLATKQNRKLSLHLTLEPVLRFHEASDHVHFHNLRIPSMFLFTGFHSDYHQPTDTADKILFAKLQRVALFTFRILRNIAERKERPYFDTTIQDVKGSGRKYGF